MRLYEGMFLVDNNLARTNYEEIETHLAGILNRFECELVQTVKWAERKLAYPIRTNNKEHSRGTYVLVHFNADPQSLIKLDRQFRLSEIVIRHILLRDEDGLFDETQKFEELFESDEVEKKTERKYRSDRPRRGKPDDGEVEAREIDAEPEAEPEAEPKAKPKAEAKAEPKAQPEAEPEVEPEAEPEVEPEVEPEAEPEVEPEAEPEVEPEAEVKAKPKEKAEEVRTANDNSSQETVVPGESATETEA